MIGKISITDNGAIFENLKLTGIAGIDNMITTSQRPNQSITSIINTYYEPTPTIEINAGSEHRLVINSNGTITWTGELTESLDVFIKVFKTMFDIEMVGPEIIRNILNENLNDAINLSKDEYIKQLEDKIFNIISDETIRKLTKD